MTGILSQYLSAESSAAKRLGKTSEFVLGILVVLLVTMNGLLPPDGQIPIEHIVGVAALVIAYVTNRTLAKSAGVSIRSGWRTSEFWTALLSSVLILVVDKFGFSLPPDQTAALVATLASLIAGRGVAKRADAIAGTVEGS